MSFTTVAFFVFLLAGIVVYYVLPKNVQCAVINTELLGRWKKYHRI